MRHQRTRIILGCIWLIVSVITFVQGQMEWWYSLLFFTVGIIFIFSAKKLSQMNR